MFIPRALAQSPRRALPFWAPRLPGHYHHRHLHQQNKPQLGRHEPTQSQGDAQQEQADVGDQGAPGGLPAPGEGQPITLDVSGGQSSTVRLGHLGPLVINADGTTGRVANWDGMTAHERETTMRLLNKRNKARLEALKAKGGGGGTTGTDGGSGGGK